MRTSRIGAVALVVAAVSGVGAQPGAFKRTVLQQVDLSAPGREVVTAVVDFQPGATVGRHTHPGEEVGYVIEGTLLLEQEGREPTTITAGKAFVIPPGTIHNATNTGGASARVLANYIVEKGKPLATPAK